MRVKSQGHFTTGFSTRDLANAEVATSPALEGVPFDDLCSRYEAILAPTWSGRAN